MPGDIDRHEWRETVEFYLELKEEEADMQKKQSDHAEFMRKLREKKLEELGTSVRAKRRTSAPGHAGGAVINDASDQHSEDAGSDHDGSLQSFGWY